MRICGRRLAIAGLLLLACSGPARADERNAPPRLHADTAARVTVSTGARLAFALDARDPNVGDPVHISALFLPAGATLKATDGNPARAAFRWRPTRPGAFAIVFSAQDHGKPRLGVTKTITVVVQAHPVAVSDVNRSSSWGFVMQPVLARAAPNAKARVVAELGTRTPEGTQNLVLVLDRLDAAPGQTWFRVRLPILPNNSTGWIRAGALDGLHVVRTHLVVDRAKLTATLYRSGRPIFTTRVGVGQNRYPTPPGQFYVRDLLIGYHDPTYGPVAFGTSGRSRVLTDWANGGYIGIHGTNQPQILPGRVSHGCIRMPNSAVLALRRLMPIGTPLTVR